MVFNQPIILKPSYLLAAFLIFIYLGAAIILFCLSLVLFVFLPVVVLLSISLIKNLRRYALQLSPDAIVEIWPKDNNEWLLKTKQGAMLRAQLLQSSYRSVYLVVLNFKVEGYKRSLSSIILPDNIAKNCFRHLRKYLLIFRGDI